MGGLCRIYDVNYTHSITFTTNLSCHGFLTFSHFFKLPNNVNSQRLNLYILLFIQQILIEHLSVNSVLDTKNGKVITMSQN